MSHRRTHTRKVRDLPVCPYSGKARYRDNRAATDAIKVAKVVVTDRAIPIRSYECVCGGWHLTSKPL